MTTKIACRARQAFRDSFAKENPGMPFPPECGAPDIPVDTVYLSSDPKEDDVPDAVDVVRVADGKLVESAGRLDATYEYDLSAVPVGTKSVVFPTFGDEFHLRSLLTLPKSIEVVYLGFEGVRYGSDDDLQEVIDHLPNLTKFSYDAGLSVFSVSRLKGVVQEFVKIRYPEFDVDEDAYDEEVLEHLGKITFYEIE